MKLKKICLYILLTLCIITAFNSVIRILESRKVVYLTEANKDEIYHICKNESYVDLNDAWKITFGTEWLKISIRVHYIFDKTDKIYTFERRSPWANRIYGKKWTR